jgi:hypothetical protein
MSRIIWVVVFGLLLFSAYLILRPPPGRFDWAEPQFKMDLFRFLLARCISALFVVGIIAVPYQIGRRNGRRGAPLPTHPADRERALTWLILTGMFVFWLFYLFGVIVKGGQFHWLSFHPVPNGDSPAAILIWWARLVLGVLSLVSFPVIYQVGARRGRREGLVSPSPLAKTG